VIAKEVDQLVQAEPYAIQLGGCGARTIVKLGMRYEGQDSEVAVEISDGPRYLNRADIRVRFLEAYKEIFGLNFPDYGIEISTWIVEVSLPEHLKSVRDFSYDALTPAGRIEKEPRSCYIGESGKEVWAKVPVFNRYALPVGWKQTGPALIE
jgi:N-methylhydantoinase A